MVYPTPVCTRSLLFLRCPSDAQDCLAKDTHATLDRCEHSTPMGIVTRMLTLRVDRFGCTRRYGNHGACLSLVTSNRCKHIRFRVSDDMRCESVSRKSFNLDDYLKHMGNHCLDIKTLREEMRMHYSIIRTHGDFPNISTEFCFLEHYQTRKKGICFRVIN